MEGKGCLQVWLWLVLCALLVAAAGLVIALIVRYNQLALARDVCREALRQLTALRRDRHELLPEFIAAAQPVPEAQPHLPGLEQALSAAQTQREAFRIGPAEEALTAQIEQVMAAVEAAEASSANRNGPQAERIEFLSTQLSSLESHISATVRYLNINAGRYSKMRSVILSAPLRAKFPPVDCVVYRANDLPAEPVSGEDTDIAADPAYRPGSVSEENA